MKVGRHEEDRMTSELLDRLNRDGEAALVEAARVVGYAELVALLPYELEPVQPGGEVWRQIEARVAEVGTEAPSESVPTLVAFPKRPEPMAEPRRDTSRPLPGKASRPVGGGALAVAASLALCLLGLGYLFARTQHQQSTIDQLRSVEARSLEVSHYYDMVRRTARQYYPLRPVSLSPREEPFYGRVWVCGMHQQWLLNIEGLKPAPAGHEYRFWFDTEEGKADGGRVVVVDGEAQLAASSMPLGTKGFAVTLEPEGSRAPKPQGRVILRAQEARDIVLGIEDIGAADSESLSM